MALHSSIISYSGECVCVWLDYLFSKMQFVDSWDNISSSLVSASCPAIISNLLPRHFAEQKTCTRQLLAFLIWVTFYSLQTHSKSNTSKKCSMESIDVIYFSRESTQFRHSGFIASDMSLCSKLIGPVWFCDFWPRMNPAPKQGSHVA